MIDANVGGIVLEIGVRDAGAQVTPLADDGIAEITVVSFVTVAKEYNVLDLAAGDGRRAKRSRTIDLRTHLDDGTFACRKGSADERPFHDLGIAADVDRSSGGIEQAMA